MFDSLSNAQVALLAKVSGDEAKARRANLLPGQYTVAPTTLTVPGGTVKVNPVEPCAPTVAVSFLSVLCIALHRAGFQRDGIMELVMASVSDSLGRGDKTADELASVKLGEKDVARAVKELQTKIRNELPKIQKNGKVFVTVA